MYTTPNEEDSSWRILLLDRLHKANRRDLAGAGLSVMIVFVFLVILTIVDNHVNGPATERAKAFLATEFPEVQPPGTAILSSRVSKAKTGNVVCESRYRCSSSYENLRRFYDRELSAMGWTFCFEEEVRGWGNPSELPPYTAKGDTRPLCSTQRPSATMTWISLLVCPGLPPVGSEIAMAVMFEPRHIAALVLPRRCSSFARWPTRGGTRSKFPLWSEWRNE
jgi:hypothetical protein